MHKPAEEYYLHDHGDGNGWQVASRPPGRFGVMTTARVKNHDGLVELEMEKYIHGALSTIDTEYYMLTPEEAHDIGNQLLSISRDAEDSAIAAREQQQTAHATK